jgi:hypothetical protein
MKVRIYELVEQHFDVEIDDSIEYGTDRFYEALENARVDYDGGRIVDGLRDVDHEVLSG